MVWYFSTIRDHASTFQTCASINLNISLFFLTYASSPSSLSYLITSIPRIPTCSRPSSWNNYFLSAISSHDSFLANQTSWLMLLSLHPQIPHSNPPYYTSFLPILSSTYLVKYFQNSSICTYLLSSPAHSDYHKLNVTFLINLICIIFGDFSLTSSNAEDTHTPTSPYYGKDMTPSYCNFPSISTVTNNCLNFFRYYQMQNHPNLTLSYSKNDIQLMLTHHSEFHFCKSFRNSCTIHDTTT